MSVVFDFNPSLNTAASVAWILLPIDLIKWKSCLMMHTIYVLFLFLSSLARQSAVSVVFVFSASLSDFVPLSPILLTVDLTRMEKE